MHFFEDLRVGETSDLGSYTFTADEIIAFASKYDRQDFHLDPELARSSPFGGLIASGWHTAAVFMKLLVAHLKAVDADMRRAGKPVARLGPSPGFESLKWIRPVHAGDTISYRTTVCGKREAKSRRNWGLVFFDNEGFNQRGEAVFSFRGKSFLERKVPAEPVR